jgi:RHS repeat-associated protein
MKPPPLLRDSKGSRLLWAFVTCLTLSALFLLPSASAGSAAPEPQEVVSMRTATSETFRNADGSYETRLYSQPVFYRSGDSWEPIDSSLIQSKASGFALENTANSFHARFKSSLSKGFMQFDPSRGKASVSISLEKSDKPGMEKRGPDALVYEDARDDADLRYDVMPTGVKETVILQDSSAPSTYVFDIVPSGDDLTADDQGDAGIYFFEQGDSKPVFFIAPPNVSETTVDGTESPALPDLASMEIEKEDDGSFRLTVSIDRKWLDDPWRRFPVYLDPTYATDLQDAYYVTQVNGVNQPTATPTMTTSLYAGYYVYGGYGHGASYTFKSVVTFNFSSIPSDAQVTDAHAHIYYTGCNNCSSGGNGIVRFRRLTTTNWRPATQWGQLTKESNCAAYQWLSSNSANGWYTMTTYSTLINAVSGIVSGSYPNYGFILEKDSDTSGIDFTFASSRQSSTLGPYLDVTYVRPPKNTSPPTIDGTPRLGQTLTGHLGTWTGATPITYTYKWQRSGSAWTDISGTVTKDEIGHTIRLCVTASNVDGSTTVCSAPTAVVPTPTLTFTQPGPDSSLFTGKDVGFTVTVGNVYNPGGTLTAQLTGVNTQTKTATVGGASATFSIDSSNPGVDAMQVSGTLYGYTLSASTNVHWVVGSSSPLETLGALGSSYATSATVPFTGTTVNSSSGNFYLPAGDIAVAGTGIPFVLTRAYNSLDTSVGVLGRGWSTSLFPSLTFDEKQNVTLKGGDGQEIGFILQPDSSYQGDSNVTATLTHPGSDYKIVLQDQEVQSFDSQGRLTSWVDQNGQGLHLTYGDGHLASVTDSGGREFDFQYDTDGHLTGVVFENDQNPDGSIKHTTLATYAYVDEHGDPCGDGNLCSETDPLGNTTRYGYDSNGYLASATDPSDKRLFANTSNSEGQVLSQQDAKDNESVFDWSSGVMTTKATDALGYSTTSTYDNANRLLSSTDALGNLPGANPAEHTTTYTYDHTDGSLCSGGNANSESNLCSVTDPLGHTTTMTYDERGNMLTREDALGNIESWIFNSDNKVTSHTDQLDHTTTYHYDENGNLVWEKDPLENKTSYSYDSAGRKVCEASPKATAAGIHCPEAGEPRVEGTTTYAYDEQGNLIESRSPSGARTTYAYDTLGRKVCETSPNATAAGIHCPEAGQPHVPGTTTYTYNAAGRLTETTDPLGHSTTSSYDEAGRLTASIDAKGSSTEYVYDENGRQTQVKSYDNANPRNLISTTGSAYDAVGNLISSTDALGGVTQYVYDAVGRKVCEASPAATSADIHCPAPGDSRVYGTTTYEYDANGNQISVTDPLGHKSTTAYDVLNRQTEQTDPLHHTTQTHYDAAGNTTSTIDALGNETTSTYDADGRLTQTTDPLGHSTTSSYDASGEVTDTTDSNGHTTHYAYDADGRKLSVTAPGGAETSFTYDASGNLVSATDPNNHTTQYTYDASGNRLSKENALNRTWHYSYDENGNLTETTMPSGGTIDQSYDSQNRLVLKNYSDSTPDVSYAYDASGQKTQMTDGEGTTLYTYDAGGDLIQASTPRGNFSYTYDIAGDLLSRTYPNGLRTSYTYDEAGEMEQATVEGETTIYGYDADGNLHTTLHPNGILDTRSYDASDRLTSIEGKKADESPFYSRSYTYDPVGNPLSMTASTTGSNLIGWPQGDSSTSWQETYTYDSRDRLAHACMNESCSRYYSYTYDGVGNRLSQTTEQGETSYSYDAADELTSAGSKNYSYDLNGNQTQAGSTHYDYNLANELTGQTKAGSQVSYTYTGDGLMATESTSSGTTDYSWDPSSDIQNLAMEGSKSYTYGQGPLGFVTGSDAYTYHTDALGSVVELSDSSGSSIESYRYSPYGEANGRGGDPEADSPLGNSLRYAGQYLDSGTDLYDMRAREYDPGVGIFLEVDPIEAAAGDPSVGVYVYVDDRPTVEVDPSGECPLQNKRTACMKNWLKWGKSGSSSFGLKALSFAKTNIGMVESNQTCTWNHQTLHVDPGFTKWYYGHFVCAPWCAIALTKWFVAAGSKVFQRGAKWEGVATMAEAALNGRSGMRVVKGTPKPGDVVAYDFSYGVAAPNDHTGIIVSASSRYSFSTIEGNTSKQGVGGTGTGSNRDGVWPRHRNIPEGSHGFNTAMFIRITK